MLKELRGYADLRDSETGIEVQFSSWCPVAKLTLPLAILGRPGRAHLEVRRAYPQLLAREIDRGRGST